VSLSFGTDCKGLRETWNMKDCGTLGGIWGHEKRRVSKLKARSHPTSVGCAQTKGGGSLMGCFGNGGRTGKWADGEDDRGRGEGLTANHPNRPNRHRECNTAGQRRLLDHRAEKRRRDLANGNSGKEI